MSSLRLLQRQLTRMPRVLHNTNTFGPARSAVVAFSSKTTDAEVKAFEEILKEKHWSDVKDEVKSIRSFLNECKTNHAIHSPEQSFEDYVATNIQHVQDMIANGNGHDEVFASIHNLKTTVKGKLYQFS